MGVFATRTPHRPAPIGLSLVKLKKVEGIAFTPSHSNIISSASLILLCTTGVGNTLWLEGIDLLEGTPILDVKPYLPFCESLKDAVAPSWVSAEPWFELRDVVWEASARSQLRVAFEEARPLSLYSSPSELELLVTSVLRRDIRSVHQQQLSSNGSIIPSKHGAYELHVEVLRITYDVEEPRMSKSRINGSDPS
mgnify:CR=1 FL=1